jgi:phenol 2-monooxygenase
MNTGVHDAVNMGWKLAGVVKGWYKPEVLHTYESERKPIAEHLIDMDKTYSALISGTIPDKYAHISSDPNVVLYEVFTSEALFTTGLGVHYDENVINLKTASGAVRCGWRAPDALVYGPGRGTPIRLQQLTPNVGTFHVVVFAGEPLLTAAKLKTFRSYLDRPNSFLGDLDSRAVKLLTIIHGNKPQSEEAMGVSRFGNVYYDHQGQAHSRYGVSYGEGGLVIIRPDGILGFATRLDAGPDISRFFARILSL